MKNVVNVNLTDPINLLIEFINIQNKNYGSIAKDSYSEYLLLVNKVREAGNYYIIEGYPRYIFENFKAGIYVVDLVFSSNNTIIPYDKCIFCQAEDDNYRLSMGSCFGFTLTKEEANALFNTIILNKMKYPYTISKVEDGTCYTIIDSTGNEMAYFSSYEKINNFLNSSLTYIDDKNDMNIDDVSVDTNRIIEEFLNN